MASDQTKLIMPSMGEGITEATLVKWLKANGDKIEADEPLLEVSTDKVDTEIPSPHSGFIHQLLVAEGADVTVGSAIALIGSQPPNSQSSSSPINGGEAKTSTNSSPTGSSHQVKTSFEKPIEGYGTGAELPSATLDASEVEDGRPSKTRSSPLVRKMAKRHGIELSDLTGTGLNGRLTKRDVEAYLTDQSSETRSKKAAPLSKAQSLPKARSLEAFGRVATEVNGFQRVPGWSAGQARAYESDQATHGRTHGPFGTNLAPCYNGLRDESS